MVASPGAGGLIAVTGATGFLGRRLVPRLLAEGWRVRVLARSAKIDPWDGDAQPQIVRGDLDAPASLSALTEGAEAMIHAAGAIKGRGRDDFFHVNVEGMKHATDSLAQGRMVLVSSLAAREPSLSDYAASKRAGEAVARDRLGERLTILRPPAIYGPGDRETLGLSRLAATSPVLPVPDDPAARLALAQVDDVVGAIVERLTAPWNPGLFAIGGARPEGYGWREIFATAADAVGGARRFVPLPPAAIRAAAAIAEGVARLRGAPAIFNRGKARELLHPDWSVSAAELAPAPRAPCMALDAGFRATVAWYRAAGWLA